MGVIVNKENQENDELSRRITADLRARAVAEGRFGWVWIVLIVLAILSLISIIFM